MYNMFFGKGKDMTNWLVYNRIINEISQVTAAGHIARAMGFPVVSEKFIIALTREDGDRVKQTKIRVLLVEQKMLKEIYEMAKREHKDFEFDRWHHSQRLDTLILMATHYFEKNNDL